MQELHLNPPRAQFGYEMLKSEAVQSEKDHQPLVVGSGGVDLNEHLRLSDFHLNKQKTERTE